MNSICSRMTEPPGSTMHGVRTLVTEIARLCALAGVSEAYVQRILSEAYATALRAPPEPLQDCADPLFASQVLTHWHECEAFLDANGTPKKLSLIASEFDDLCDAAGDRSRAGSALSLLLASGAVIQSADTVSPARRSVIVGQSFRPGVELAIRLCGEFAKTLNYNQTRSDDEPRRFERTALSTRFAAQHVPALLAYLSLHAESFLEDIDNWLKARESLADSESLTAGVGVHLFLSN